MQIINPTTAGMIIDLPASPPNTTLQVIFATAIKIITEIPKYKLRFQNAAAKEIRDIGTSIVIKLLVKFQSFSK